MASFLSIFINEQQHPNSPFDLLPDDVIYIIFNKVQDAKTLLASFSLNKRLASIIPKIEAISLSIDLPDKKKDNNNENYNNRRRNNDNYTVGNYINIAKSTANYLITKLLHRSSSNNNNNDGNCDPTAILCQRLRLFSQIKHLHLELHNDNRGIKYELLKWKANYDRHFKSFEMLLCDLSFRYFSAGEWLPESERSTFYFEDRALSWCMEAASKRHCMVKEMLPFFLTLETVTITDAMRRGRFFMAERDVQDLRESLKEERMLEVNPRLVKRRWHAQWLELPSVRCTWKDAMLVVVDPVHVSRPVEYFPPKGDPMHGDPPLVPMVKVDGGGDSYECDAEERAMFEDAQREILTASQGVELTYKWARWTWVEKMLWYP